VRKIDIPVQSSRVEQETGLKKHRQQKAFDLLSEKGFVKVDASLVRKKITLNGVLINQSAQRIFPKINKSILRFLNQLISSTPAPKEKPKAKQSATAKVEKPPKSASGKVAMPANQIGLFD
jgi:hypothetical protein